LEAQFPQMLSCIYRIKNNHLVSGISPSLHHAYIDAMEGILIGENEGSCGAAAALKQQVIVSDIATDPKWEKYKDTALAYHLQACWSNPVIDAHGEVIATVAMYYKEPRLPGEDELKVMERATALLRIILENRQKTEIIGEANLMMQQSQELAHFGNWRWDIQLDIVSWSPVLYTIYGLDPKDFKATFAGYQERLHPDDRERVYQLIGNVLKSGQDAEFEERIIRPDGEVRYLRSWAKLKTDQYGLPAEMLGACLSITLFFPVYSRYFTQGAGLQLALHGYDWLWLLLLAGVCTVYAFSTSVELMKRISAFVVNLTINLEPVYGIVLAQIMFGLHVPGFGQEKMSGGVSWVKFATNRPFGSIR
ncbi:MAG: GAF domain-containing protein, partial [Cytophagaceae bacterium]